MDVSNGKKSDAPTLAAVFKNKNKKIVDIDRKAKIVNLHKKYVREQPNMGYGNLINLLSKETGIGLRVVKSTVSDYLRLGKICLASRKRAPSSKVANVSDAFKSTIRRKVHDLWFGREWPAPKKVLRAINNDPKLPKLSRSSLQRLMNAMHFKYLMLGWADGVYVETEDLVLSRAEFIEQMRRFRGEGRNVYFLSHVQIEGVGREGKLTLDVAHVGSSAGGFVKGDVYCNSSDATDDSLFSEWFLEILSELDGNSVVAIDCAKHPGFDRMIEISGRAVARLPPGHVELNPMESAWSAIKCHVAQNVDKISEIEDVIVLVADGLKRVCTPAMWASFVELTIKEEDKLWQVDAIVAKVTPRLSQRQKKSLEEKNNQEKKKDQKKKKDQEMKQSSKNKKRLVPRKKYLPCKNI